MKGIILRAIAISLLVAGAPAVAAPVVQPAPRDSAAQFETLVADAKAAMLSDPLKAIGRAKAAEAYATHIPAPRRTSAIASAQWLQGEAYSRIGDTAHAGPLIDHAIALIQNDGPPTKLYGDLLLSRGGVKTAQADVAGALAAYQHAHDVFRIIGETRSRALALVSIGVLYQEAGDYKAALKYYAQSIDVYAADPQLLFSIYSNRGGCYLDLNQLSEAQVEFRKALDIARALASPVLEARTLRNIARGQLVAGQLDAADRTIARGFDAARGEDAASARNHFLVLSAWSAQQRGRLPLAQRLIGRAFATVDANSSTIDLREGHQIAYDIYKKAGNHAAALIHLEALKQFDDKTSKLASSANTALAAARFDFANQELNLEKLKRVQLQRNIDDAKLRARNQQIIFGGLAVATVIIVALLTFGLITIRRSRNEVRAANVDLGETNAALGKALAAKTEFLATTSHEIRTPLNGILGMTQVMLADATLDATLRDRIGVVHSAGVTMRALVDDILDVAKMETGNLTLENVPFELSATLRDVSRLWEEQARAKGLAFVLDLDGCPAFVTGDAARLRQICFNLLSNALKFTTTGSVSLRASASESTLSIAVVDSGIGIPADKLGIIFESFRQGDAGTTRQFGGTGLGLAICRNLARAMDGNVVVASTPGGGSTFTLHLPLRLAPAPAAQAADPALAPSALLILDRNPISRSMLRAVLEPRAGNVVFATSVVEAMARIAEGGITRILIDDATIKAADDMDAALAALGATTAASALLWASPDDADRARFAALGIDQVVAKPIAGVALAALLFETRSDARVDAFQLVTQAA